ncbi:hypothetical protein CDL12_16917 [Handroanthus impetiginosus]|uniref:Uncharacterized protein n=1 Tax=Handroanthus impetiginosus TaxID=429701 RepID=A0A2G9GZ51_9LAMI|nr:hypothetical protein CDL12_16917 [Handroanthus impetiginosus]
MAISPLRSKALRHGRSLSFPSKLNPTTSHFEENLSIVKGSEALCSSFSSMKNRVNGLKNLYNNIDDLLLLPHIQQIISLECESKWVHQVSDGYIRLLDVSVTAKDLFSQTKHDLQELLSTLRRKDMDGIRGYLNSRRKSKKIIQKYLKTLKTLRSKNNVATLKKDEEIMAVVYMLKEAESVTAVLIESLLSFLNGSRVENGWSLVSKLMNTKKVSNHDLNEFEKMDALLQMNLEDVQVEEIMSHLKEMESKIQNLEDELECLFRQLIKTRVSLLNVLNH